MSTLKVCFNTVYKIVFEQSWPPKLARKGKPYKPRKKSMVGAYLISNQKFKEVDNKQEIKAIRFMVKMVIL